MPSTMRFGGASIIRFWNGCGVTVQRVFGFAAVRRLADAAKGPETLGDQDFRYGPADTGGCPCDDDAFHMLPLVACGAIRGPANMCPPRERGKKPASLCYEMHRCI